MRNAWALLSQTFTSWNAHEAPRLSAALAFYTILSLAPLMILVTAVVALAFGHSTAQGQILSQVESMVGHDGAEAVKGIMEHAEKPSSGLLATVIGIATLLFGASGVFTELRSALNKVWDVKEDPSAGFMELVKQRFFSFGMVLSIGFLLLVSLILSAALAALGKFFGGILPLPEIVLSLANFLISFVGITLLFALIFKYVPETKVTWREVWVGAACTAFLFSVGKALIGLYLGKAAVGSAYGAAGSFVVIIVWVYYSALIFFFGAEFTRLRAKMPL